LLPFEKSEPPPHVTERRQRPPTAEKAPAIKQVTFPALFFTSAFQLTHFWYIRMV
jgi:hypothetical protein